MKLRRFQLAILAVFTSLLILPAISRAEELPLSLRYQKETAEGTGRFHQLHRVEKWDASQTALIVCDVWDLHHSLNAVRRVEEIGPRLNEFVKKARSQGVTIIHAPSDCMAAYADHPARLRAMKVPAAENLPADISSWCSKLPVEEQVVYPLDQSDGGDDDDPAEHAAWAKKLAEMGRKPGNPWLKQSDLIEIDKEKDYISDKGDEVWNILAEQGINNVMLTGVHTNMCVLGRPFGLRQLSSNGKNVVLVRDLTDTMYNPKRWPYVSHFTGTDLIVSHIERHICPTITSDQLLGGQPLRFKHDERPHLVMLIAEDEYETDATLPKFAADYLGRQFRVSMVYDDEKNKHDLPGLEVLDEADALLISVRRRPLPAEQLERIEKFVATGKPVIGIRTASHAFSTRSGLQSTALKEWPELDGQVFGGHYTTHHGNQLECTVEIAADHANHPILSGIPDKPFKAGGSLYKTSPLAKGTTALMMGKVHAQPEEPVAWTFERADGGKTFYTSLGHKEDFENPAFVRLLYNGICWATEVPIPEELKVSQQQTSSAAPWSLVKLPGTLPEEIISRQEPAVKRLNMLTDITEESLLKVPEFILWYRCGIRITNSWLNDADLQLEMPRHASLFGDIEIWLNGKRIIGKPNKETRVITYDLPRGLLELNDVNLLVLKVPPGSTGKCSRDSLSPPILRAGQQKVALQGTWQARCGNDVAWSNIPLPARYGIGADIIFEPGLKASR